MKKSILFFVLINIFCIISILSRAQAPGWLWTKSVGGTSSTSSVVVDASGNLYLAGTFGSPTLTFGSDTLTNKGSGDIFLVKYDNNGNVLWAKSAGREGSDYPISIAVDAAGNLYMAGNFTSLGIDFDSITLFCKGKMDVFIVKYDANGNVLWAKREGGTKNDYVKSIVLNSSGKLCVIGNFSSPSISFGSITLYGFSYQWENFLVKYDTDGKLLGATTLFGAGWGISLLSLAADAYGNLFVAGEDNESNNIYIAKYKSNGELSWYKNLIGYDSESEIDITVDASGNSFVAGIFTSSTITFDTITLTNAFNGRGDIYVAKYDVNGNVLWAKSSGGSEFEIEKCVFVDPSGNLYLAGEFASRAINFGTYELINIDFDYDIFLAKYSTNGNVLWAKSVAGTGSSQCLTMNSLTMDVSGSAILSGHYTCSSVLFGNDTLTLSSGSQRDIFLAASISSNIGITELYGSSKISIFPNPASDKITIETTDNPYRSELSIINICGKTLITRELTEPKMQLDISGLPNGVYLVRLTSEKKVQMAKFVKQK